MKTLQSCPFQPKSAVTAEGGRFSQKKSTWYMGGVKSQFVVVNAQEVLLYSLLRYLQNMHHSYPNIPVLGLLDTSPPAPKIDLLNYHLVSSPNV